MRRAGALAPAAGPARFTIAPPENASFGGPRRGGSGTATQLAVSPDGRHIVFVAAHRHHLSDLAATGRHARRDADAGNRGRHLPVLVARQPIDRVLRGWQAEDRSDCRRTSDRAVRRTVGSGGSWSRDNVILFAPGPAATGLLRVSSSRRRADGRHDPRQDDRRRRPPLASLSARWPALHLHGRHRTLLSRRRRRR